MSQAATADAGLDQWVRSCLRKRRYSNEALASRVASRAGRERRVSLRAYYCPHCSGWHLTHLPAWSSKQ